MLLVEYRIELSLLSQYKTGSGSEYNIVVASSQPKISGDITNNLSSCLRYFQSVRSVQCHYQSSRFGFGDYHRSRLGYCHYGSAKSGRKVFNYQEMAGVICHLLLTGN